MKYNYLLSECIIKNKPALVVSVTQRSADGN